MRQRHDDPLPVRLYRRALVILPRAFRRRYAAGMVAMLADEWRERRGLARGALLARALFDLLRTAAIERISGSRRRQQKGSRTAAQIALGLVVGVTAAAVIERLTGGGLLDERGAVLLPALAPIVAAVGLLAALGSARRGLKVQPRRRLSAAIDPRVRQLDRRTDHGRYRNQESNGMPG